MCGIEGCTGLCSNRPNAEGFQRFHQTSIQRRRVSLGEDELAQVNQLLDRTLKEGLVEAVIALFLEHREELARVRVTFFSSSHRSFDCLLEGHNLIVQPRHLIGDQRYLGKRASNLVVAALQT